MEVLHLTMSTQYGSLSPTKENIRRKNSTTCQRNIIILGICITSIVIGFMIGWSTNTNQYVNVNIQSQATISQISRDDIFSAIKAENIKENLRKYSSFPHLSGTDGEKKLGDILYDTWTQQGLDYVTRDTYDVLLSFPNKSDDSVIRLLDSSGAVLFESQRKEKNLTSDQNHPDIVPPYNAYSPAGDVHGPLAYVNYGEFEDFEYLSSLNVSLEGTVCIARYGRIVRGTKATEAFKNGCIGLILYTDPQDYHLEDVPGYPDSWWMPPTGVQRGNVQEADGDPLTPGYPAISSAYRISDKDNLKGLPSIPVHPISYGDAKVFLSGLSGPIAPATWQGGLDIVYHIGPGSLTNKSVHMHVTTYNERRNTSNIIGYIVGSEEPDRYVVVGNHYDAWVFGAVDPNSGTAVMTELSRVLIEAKKKGWRPHRTIIFCAWGAEEPRVIGSTEWLEHYAKLLGDRAVAYLNVDTMEGNETLKMATVPSLYNLAYQAAKQVKAPYEAGTTLYDKWFAINPDTKRSDPYIGPVGSGSDHAMFLAYHGISAMDFRLTYDKNKWAMSGYPLYHTSYETFDMMQTFMDPDFKYSKALCEYWAELVLCLCDATILPFNVLDYATALDAGVRELQETYGQLLEEIGVSLVGLQTAIVNFNRTAVLFHARLNSIELTSKIQLRAYNDQLMKVERSFVDTNGLPGRPEYRHVIFAPNQFNVYAGAIFPGVTDGMTKLQRGENPKNISEEMQRHLANVEFIINSAESTLRPFSHFNEHMSNI